MFTEEMARITAHFAAQVFEALRAASIEELRARRSEASLSSRAKRSVPRAPKRELPRAAPADRSTIEAAIHHFVERGRKGATAEQLGAYLAERGLSDKTDVIGVLQAQGSIRDAGFRRSTGVGNKTSPVYVTAG